VFLSWLFGLLLSGCASTPGQGRARVPQIHAERVDQVRSLVRRAAKRHGVPEDLVLAVIQVESSFRQDVCSGAGACGLMQLMPRTAAGLARRLGWEDYDIADPRFNIQAGTSYLAYLMRRFGRLDLALAAYNAGPARVARQVSAGEPLPGYSQRYIAAVDAARARFASLGVEGLQAGDRTMDREGLRALLRRELYGERPDEPIPAD
jgi:soluble lytic murein transglycosylase-like protein